MAEISRFCFVKNSHFW